MSNIFSFDHQNDKVLLTKLAQQWWLNVKDKLEQGGRASMPAISLAGYDQQKFKF